MILCAKDFRQPAVFSRYIFIVIQVQWECDVKKYLPAVAVL